MNCCISSCVNSGNAGAKNEHVTFHRFPSAYHLRQLWIEAVGIPEWELNLESSVCSMHFRETDFVSILEKKELSDGAVPVVINNTHSEIQGTGDIKACRVCLGMEMKMYNIKDYNLQLLYEFTVGVMVGVQDRLPKMLCWECASKLVKMRMFKEKALRSHMLLSSRANHMLTIDDIKSINRLSYNLNSNLTIKHHEVNKFDLDVSHDKVDVVEEIKIEINNINAEVPDNDDINNSEAVDMKLEASVLKDELSEINDNNYSFSESDDIELSELSTKVRKRKAKVTVKKEKPEVKKRKTKVKKEAVEVKKNNEDSNDIMDKYKPKMKRRVRSYDVSDSHFETRKLTYEEQVVELQLRQQSASYLNSPFKCTVCFKGFKSEGTYNLHSVRHSEKYGAYECFICKRRFKNPRHQRLHITSLHTEEFSCKACEFVTRCRGIAIDHQKWHSGNTYECPHCPAKFGKFTSYMSHLRIKHSSKFACELCGYTFVSKRGVEMHKAKRHKLQDTNVKLEGPYCEDCKIRFVSDEAYLRHLTQSSVHSSDNDPNRIRNDWGCKEQAEVVRRRRKKRAAGVIVQWGADHPDRPKQLVNCEQCGIQLDSYRMYSHHFRVDHPGMNRTKFARVAGNCMCEQCGKMFACKALLIDHMTSHTGEKRFKCDSCDKAFTNKNNLTVHQRLHGAEVPTYQCPYCEKQFHFYQNCNRHVKTVHKGVKQFQCEICGKEFTSSAGQRAHVDHVHHKKPRPKRVRVRPSNTYE